MKALSCLVFALAFQLCAQTLTFEEQTFDFGEITDLEPVVKTVTFKNSGDKTLEITNVKASCGCTTGKLAKKTYEPGESGTVDITFNPKGKSGKTTKHVHFTSNDPEAKSRSVTFSASIQSVFGISPSNAILKFEGGKYDKESATFTITNRHTEEMKVLSCSSRSDNILVDPIEPYSIAAGETSEITVKVKEDFAPERNHYAYVQVRIGIGNTQFNKHLRATIQVPRK